MYNECFAAGCLSPSQREAVLTLIFKKSNKNEIKNYRPISLTNVDYKILAFTLSQKLQQVIPSIRNEDQTAYVKNRYIVQNCRVIQDVIEHVNNNKLSGFLLFMDFEKSLRHGGARILISNTKKVQLWHEFYKMD